MNDEEIKAKAECLIRKFLSIWMTYEISDSEFERHINCRDEHGNIIGHSFGYGLSTKQAIECQKEVVNVWGQVFNYHQSNFTTDGLESANKILEHLNKRIK